MDFRIFAGINNAGGLCPSPGYSAFLNHHTPEYDAINDTYAFNGATQTVISWCIYGDPFPHVCMARRRRESGKKRRTQKKARMIEMKIIIKANEYGL